MPPTQPNAVRPTRQQIHSLRRLRPPLRQIFYELPRHTLLAPVDVPALRHALGNRLFVDSNKLAFNPLQFGQRHIPRWQLKGQPRLAHLDLEDASQPSTRDSL